jgi:phage gp29-like protein
MARFAEVHGAPWVLGEVPFASDPGDRSKFQDDLANVGASPRIMIGKGASPEQSYGVSLVEAKDTAFGVFGECIKACDLDITLAILGQNLTTQVSEGSFAAAEVHAGVKDDFVVRDAVSWATTIMACLSIPFAEFNFGRKDLAPIVVLDDTDQENRSATAGMLKDVGAALHMIRLGGWTFERAQDLRYWVRQQFGIDVPDMKEAMIQEGNTDASAAPTSE